MIVYKAKANYEPVHICEKCGKEMKSAFSFERFNRFFWCDDCRIMETGDGFPVPYEKITEATNAD